MVLGTGGELPKDVLLGRGAYLRRARTQGAAWRQRIHCWGDVETFLRNVSVLLAE